MKQNLTPAAIRGQERTSKKSFNKVAASLFLFLAVMLISNIANATHFRFGLITATRLSETSTTVTYRLNVSLSWRLGTAMTPIPFTVTGGTTTSINVPMTTVTDPSGGWDNSTGSATITLKKSSTPTRIEYTSCCKISTTANNHDTNWDVYCILNTNAPGSSPVSTLPAIINVPIGATAATFSIPASDPDAGSTLTYGMPVLTSGPLSGEVQPSGATVNNANFNVNSSTGLVTFNTVGKSVGQQFNAMTTVTDNDGNQIELDYLLNMVGPSNPPAFDYTVTPINGAVFNIIVGQTLSFPIRATDPDAGQTVSFSVSGLTSFLTTANFGSAALPATGMPALTHLTYTPAAAQLGSTIILNFIATDNVGVQTTSSVTIKVVGEPAPTFINPTPGEGTIRSILAGSLHTDQIVAESSLGSNVSIAFATTPSGVTNSPVVPTAGANPGSTTMSWTPTSADFGQHTFTYQATIAATPTIFSTRNFDLIVDDLPAFTSTPVTTASACNSYTYNVTASDANIPYGDFVDIMSDDPLPSWLTLTSTGNGTATFSGTPSLADVGTYNIDINAEDNYPHNYPSVDQSFTITVSANSITASTGSNGTVSALGTAQVCPNSSPVYTITPDAGYHVADVLVDGVSVGAVTSYTFAPITADHTISATFALNCTAPSISSAATTTDVTCNGGANGTATTYIAGTTPIAVSWDNGANTAGLSGVAAGTYTYTATNACGSISGTATVNEPTAVVASSTTTDVICNGGSTGTVTVSATGGVGGYTGTGTFNGIAAGPYTYNVTDANGCPASASGNVNEPTVVVASSTTTDVLCNGGSTGTVIVSATGGVGGYTGTGTFTGLAAGPYAYTVTDANNCPASTSGTINEPTLLTATSSNTAILCNGGTSVVTVAANGGTAPYFGDGAQTPVVAGGYSYTVRDNNGCTATTTGTIGEPTQLTVTSSNTAILCSGGTSVVTVAANGGIAPYFGDGAQTPVVAGGYSYTVRDNNGCTATTSGTISEPAKLVASSSSEAILCNGKTTAVNVSATGGTMPYTGTGSYTVGAGTYTYTVSDANGCSATTSITLTEPTAVVVSATIGNVSCNGLSDGSIAASSAGGTPSYSYLWSTGSTSASITGKPAGTYTVTVTDGNACKTNTSFTIAQPDVLSLAGAVATNVSCRGLNNGSIATNVAGGTTAYNYTWSTGSHSANLTALAPGAYSVTVTDAHSCTVKGSYTITQPSAVLALSASKTNAVCNGSNGSVTTTVTGGTTAYSYLWSNGATTANLSAVAGSYSVTVTDARGCTVTGGTYTITQPTAITFSARITNVKCNGDNSGYIDFSASGGTPGYSYAWTPGSGSCHPSGSDLRDAEAGTYTVTVTDSRGCKATASYTITEPTAINITAVTTNVSCHDGNDGAINTTVTGGTAPYYYTWGGGCGTHTADRTGLGAGTYYLTVTDANGCSKSVTYTVTEPSAISLSAVVTNVSCRGMGNGSINTTVSGGTAPYTYLWSNGSTSADPSGLAPGSYSVTVKDAHGCTRSCSYTVTQPSALAITASLGHCSRCSGSTGSINTTVSGGNAPYTYAWSNGKTTADLSSIPTGTYTVIVTDAHGCTTTASWTINCTGGGHDDGDDDDDDDDDHGHGHHGHKSSNNSSSTATVSEIRVYPNPAHGIFSVQIPVINKAAEVQVLDMAGRVIEEKTISDNDGLPVQFNIANTAKGIYMVKVTADGNISVAKLIIE